MKKSFFLSILVVVFAVFATGCGGDDKSADNLLTALSVGDITNLNVSFTAGTATATVCKDFNMSVKVDYTAPKGAKVTPASGTTHDFATGPLTITVEAENGDKKTYTVTITKDTTLPCQ